MTLYSEEDRLDAYYSALVEALEEGKGPMRTAPVCEVPNCRNLPELYLRDQDVYLCAFHSDIFDAKYVPEEPVEGGNFE